MKDKDTIAVLTKNSVKCLVCGTVLESKHRHNFVSCGCYNQTFTDGGNEYLRFGGKDLDLIENLCEYRTLTQKEYNKEQEEFKAKQLAKNEQGIKDGLLIKIGNEFYSKKVLSLLYNDGSI